MFKFFYKVKNTNGHIEQGSISAISLSEAATMLEEKGLVILEIKEEYRKEEQIKYSNQTNYSGTKIFTISEKKEFFNSMYFLYRSGNSILQVFDSMCRSSHNPKIKYTCNRILNGISKGYSLKESMKFCIPILGSAYTMLIVAGEESGKLENVLYSIIQNISMQEKIKNDIISKSTYPAIMFLLAIFVALLFKFFIINIFVASASGETFCMTSLVFSALFKIIFVFALIGALIFIIYKNKDILLAKFSKVFNYGFIGDMLKNYAFTNYFSVLALSHQAGITTSTALQLARSVVTIYGYSWKLKKAEDRVSQGCELTTALAATSLFSDYAISQVSSGEKSGELDTQLQSVAKDYESKLKLSIDVALKFVEPLMIIFVGLMVLYVAVSGYKAYYGYIFSLI